MARSARKRIEGSARCDNHRKQHPDRGARGVCSDHGFKESLRVNKLVAHYRLSWCGSANHMLRVSFCYGKTDQEPSNIVVTK
jgi:hypothetical protein